MKQIRSSKFSKFLAYYLAIMMFLQVTQPLQMYALTEGPSQPEFNAFTPIGTSDMVDLSSGDFNYNIPIMDVGGYPLNLAYNSGVTMDQESSWVGLGWNLNVGQINRQMRGLPDDFNGDEMVYENNMKDNITIGANFGFQAAVFGFGENNEPPGLKLSSGLGVNYNNYDGIGFSVTGGLSYQVSNSLTVGMQMESSVSEGVSASPSISLSSKLGSKSLSDYSLGLSAGVSYNSRKGISSMTLSPSVKRNLFSKTAVTDKNPTGSMDATKSGTISFNPDASYTPTKRIGMKSSNYMFNLDIEGSIWGFEPGTKFSGFRTSQGIDDSEKYKTEKAFGYENTYEGKISDILDFNREKDRTVNRNTSVLPMTNYTYDIYNIQGQGVSGMFRPYRSQVGFVYDNYTEDKSNGGNVGVEVGIGPSQDWGFNATVTISNSHSKLWSSGNHALTRFKEKKVNDLDYEKVYFKNIGGNHVDKDWSLINNDLGKYSAIKFDLTGDDFGRNATSNYYKKVNGTYTGFSNSNSIARSQRMNRNQTIQKLTRKEAGKFGYSKNFSEYAKDHHTAEIRIQKDGGQQYVFGKALYNVVKKEVTFDISGIQGDCKTGLVSYTNGDNSPNNKRNGDQYFNRITTPAYAHTYLLTHVLSSDYQDIDDKPGPSDNDLGSYTKFIYDNELSKRDGLFKWRVPFMRNKANFDEGLKSSKKDDKGNYEYGEKELSYIKKIETKTHIAVFDLSPRKDGYGVMDENGGFNENSKSYKLNTIKLYSKPEYLKYGENAKPIKTAHFVYDYSMCQGIDNNIIKYNANTNIDEYELENQGGKLTLKKVYFTYRDSNMGKYTPYEFNYQNNYNYNMKSYDIWGNYKPASDNISCAPRQGDMSNTEYPFVDQSNKSNIDNFSSAWHLNSVKLPSGGTIELDYESDDYAFVQDQEAMQMFKVIGAGNGQENGISDNLFNSEYLYIRINEDLSTETNPAEKFKQKYIRTLYSEPIYFRFLVNMSDPNPLPLADTTDKYDYVTGYLQLANENPIILNNNIVAIKIQTVNKGDGLNSGKQVNPISKAGWQFGRAYLNKLVYGITNEEDTNNLKSVVMELLGTLPSVFQIVQSPNGRLEDKRIASKFVPNKSWIRLKSPNKIKLGGGSRVKQVRLKDDWDIMTNHENDPVYSQFYGQEYSYTTEDGNGTSGVATYEPLGCKENPLVKPFYDRSESGLQKLLGVDQQNYVEEPLGESFFPSPKVTYSRVSVKNIPRKRTEGEKEIIVKKHATGRVVTEFFTSFDYPTIVDYTTISSHYDKSPLAGILNINVKEHLTMSQGFSIHTNDMDGKMKSQRVYAEGQHAFISGVDYKYSNNTSEIKENGLLNNYVTTINSDGLVKENIIGVDYDVINDFRESKSVSSTPGVRFNTEGLPLLLVYLIVPTPLPTFSRHENQLRTAVTTKVIHSSGILRETVAYDVGAVVSTKNLAWDANTGEVLLTQTVNEYNDNYYSFNYPAYWNNDYKGMGQSMTNLDIVSNVQITPDAKYHLNGNTSFAKKYLLPGDELWVSPVDYDKRKSSDRSYPFKAWVMEVDNSGAILIDKDGLRVDKYDIKTGTIKIIRSGYRNLQLSSMASITSMINPLDHVVNNHLKPELFKTSSWSDYRIINASAIEYANEWPGQCECNLPQMTFSNDQNTLVFNYDELDVNDDNADDIIKKSYNPYLYNILGNWRAKRSYAYLTGRHNSNNATPRVSGFFKDFEPFYVYDATNKWAKNSLADQKWTFASEITQYNPYGQELENKDALDRYSSALYGYNYQFPLAVASNTKYNELAYDGFEDYDFSSCDSLSHFNFESSLEDNIITITEQFSHTGRRSIRVAPSEVKDNTLKIRKAKITKQIISCDDATPASSNKGKAIRTIK